MSTAGIPTTLQLPKQAVGPNKTEAKGIEGLFELISQGLNFDTELAAGQSAHGKTPGLGKGHCIEQCLSELETDLSLEDTGLNSGLNMSLETASLEVSQELNNLENNGSEPGVQTAQASGVNPPARSETANNHLADIRPIATDQLTAGETPGKPGAANTSTEQGNTPEPLARAIQVLHALGGSETPQPTDKPHPALASQNANSLSNPAPGLEQARQQLEANLLRWAGDNRTDTRLDPATALNSTVAQNTASATSAVVASQQSAAAQPAPANPAHSFNLPGNIHQPAWQQALAERVVMLTHQNIHQAELKLHPAELGSVSVRLESLQDGPQSQTQLQFAALNADTREALEAALPKLRELFNQQGMNLVRADIQHSFSQDQGDPSSTAQGQDEASDNTAASDTRITDAQSQTAISTGPSDSLLDLYV
ncbi:MAG: flagellar hook-length control protein FliK [Salinisphaeraceae bacterium]|nr:flagellar hook-length control protein FliK [Salinisphaeraceae bacterium]